MREGAYTLNARTVREQTATMPNHTAILTGRRVDGEHGGHGYTVNVDNGTTVHPVAGHYVASVFDVVHDSGGSTALFASKIKFNVYRRTWNSHGGPDRVGRDDGHAKIDRFIIDRDNTRLVAKITAELRRSPREFTFVHLSLPDRAGHSHGFMGKEYLDAVESTDRLLGRILNAVATRPVLRPHTLVLLTADHGGTARATMPRASCRTTGSLSWRGGEALPRGGTSMASTPAFAILAPAAPAIAGSSRSVTPTSPIWRLMPLTCHRCRAQSSTIRAR